MHITSEPSVPVDPSNLPPPAVTQEDRLARLRLIRSDRIGPVTFRQLIRKYGSASEALLALPDKAHQAKLSGYKPCPEGLALKEIERAQAAGAKMFCLGDSDYPSTLATISDAPPVLWAIGAMDCLARPSIAIVGTRNASALGCRMARRLARELGQAGFTITSGLARGIDTQAHKAALETGTMAMHAGGVDVVYPAENRILAENIAETGLRLSEQPMGTKPQAKHFPRRNRLVSGISQGVIIVEAALRSGSMITARYAADQGREVMAVPGHPLDTRASGSNALIAEGACLVQGTGDVISALGYTYRAAERDQTEPPGQTSDCPTSTQDLKGQIVNLLSHSAVAEAYLFEELGATAPEISAAITELEIEGLITRVPGGNIARAPDL